MHGLYATEVKKRLAEQRKKQKIREPWSADLLLFLFQFKSPLVLLLVFAAILSIILGEYSDSGIILVVLLTTGILGFVQERNAGRAVRKLQELVHNKAMVRREGKEFEIVVNDVVPGDILILNAGDIITADSYILEANDLHVNESALTGESFPVEKFAVACKETVISKAVNAVFKGTSVINGTATVLAINTADNTELGKITHSLEQARPVSAFEKGITHFGYMLMRLTIFFTGLILILNIAFHRSFIESLLFSLALTVGLTPELLPAVLTITLTSGAKRLAAKKVIVKKLDAIQDLGEADILCSDKTGTITEGVVSLQSATGIDGKENQKLLLFAYLNAYYETGFSNPIDESIRAVKNIDISRYKKTDEVPYDFIRKRLSIVVAPDENHTMITKGAVNNIIEVCNRVEFSETVFHTLEEEKINLQRRYEELSEKGFRVIALAYKDVTGDPVINKDDETGMTFLGFLVFSDPVKEGIINSINRLKKKGITLKIVTGDSYLVARYIAAQVEIDNTKIITGPELNKLNSDALKIKVEQTAVFAEILPAQKELIVKVLQSSGHSVCYLGDGINDANALKAADVGISVNTAVDVAKEAADLVLLDRSIDVINDGIEEGRRTSANTLKYILVTTSANFGNMFSMAIASLFLPFLPLLPVQILLNNFLSDVPALAIASDNVDEESVIKPGQWNMHYIWRFMIVFGLQSSLFDFALFGLLYYVFRASTTEFRTAWFMESLLTEILILLIIRSGRTFFKSRPSKYLLLASGFTFFACILLPYLPFARIFQLYPLPFSLFAVIIIIVLLYIVLAEISKKYLMKK
jgi:P-type Mg2+ transporter